MGHGFALWFFLNSFNIFEGLMGFALSQLKMA